MRSRTIGQNSSRAEAFAAAEALATAGENGRGKRSGSCLRQTVRGRAGLRGALAALRGELTVRELYIRIDI